jgi:hypothetical protein
VNETPGKTPRIGQPLTAEETLIAPGKPRQNGTTESFDGKFRDECLTMEWFRNRLEARVVIEDWRQHDNRVRLYSSLNYETPEAFGKKAAIILPTGVIRSLLGPKKPVRSAPWPKSG